MKVLLFGASGFIGQHLEVALNEKYTIQNVSLRAPNWQGLIADADVFINLIGKAHDHKGEAEEKDFYRVNCDLVKEIFKAFIHSKATQFIHISSIAAIEEIESNQPIIESDPCRPQSFYGKSKREAEIWLMSQALPQGKSLCILRPPMVHGSGDKGNLGLLYKLVSKGIPYPLAAFDNKRSFISIQNFSFFIEQILENQGQRPSVIYHICDDEPVSTRQIISLMRKIENKKGVDLSLPRFIVKGLAFIGDCIPFPLNTIRLKKLTSNLTISNQKIKTVLGIDKLPLSAEEGLIKTIQSFKTSNS